MATPYTSARDGEWDASATDTWGQGIGVYPNTSADVVNIGHVVTYNVVMDPASVEMGQVTINAGGNLTFSNAMSTYLSMGNADLRVNATGILTIGSSGSVIPRQFTAKISFNTTGDNAKGMNFQTTSVIDIYGDPAYYGSDDDTVLNANWTSGQTFTVTGDFTDDGVDVAIAGLSAAAACVVTWTGHGLSTADKVIIAGITQNSGDSDWTALNGTRAITYIDANSFSVAVDTSAYTVPYDTGDPGTISAPKWKVGQELYVHKLASTYSSYTTDVVKFNIASIALNGANTDITIAEAAPGVTFNAGGAVVNAGRNIQIFKYGVNTAIGQFNTNRPTFTGTAFPVVNCYDAQISGIYNNNVNYANYVRTVIRNSLQSFVGTGASGESIRLISNSQCLNASTGAVLTTSKMLCCNSCVAGTTFNVNLDVEVYSCNLAFSPLYNSEFSQNSAIYGCASVFIQGLGIKLRGKLGYSPGDVSCANTSYFNFGSAGFDCVGTNVKLPSGGLTITSRNSLYMAGTKIVRLALEDVDQVQGTHYIYDAYGDIIKTPSDGTGDNPSLRSGGGANIIEVIPQSNCNTSHPLEILNIRHWATTGSQVFRFYVQTDYATLPTAEIKLYGEYLDNTPAGTGHLTQVISTQDITTRANQADWSQYLEVTLVPAVAGYVNLYIRLMGYESTKKVWIDPEYTVT